MLREALAEVALRHHDLPAAAACMILIIAAGSIWLGLNLRAPMSEAAATLEPAAP